MLAVLIGDQGAKIVDPETSEIITGMDVRLEDGKIVQITPSDSEAMAGYRDHRNTTVIDASGLYMCPGLIDCMSCLGFMVGAVGIRIVLMERVRSCPYLGWSGG